METSKTNDAALKDAMLDFFDEYEVVQNDAKKEDETLHKAIVNGVKSLAKDPDPDDSARGLIVKPNTALKLGMTYPEEFVKNHLGGYQFKNQGLLLRALLHRKYRQKDRPHSKLCCDPLDFVGDFVLKFIIGRYLLINSQKRSKEELSKRRAMVERQEVYAFLAVKNNFHKYLFLDDGMEWEPLNEYIKSVENLKTSTEIPKGRKSFIYNFFQAVAGAIFVDANYSHEKVEEIFLPILEPELKAALAVSIEEDE